MSKTLHDIGALILKLDSQDELDGVVRAVKAQRDWLGAVTSGLLTVGDTVEFTSSRTGLITRGTVTRKNPKRARVETDLGGWTVPYSMLTKVE